jgi:hypothetical protein
LRKELTEIAPLTADHVADRSPLAARRSPLFARRSAHLNRSKADREHSALLSLEQERQ